MRAASLQLHAVELLRFQVSLQRLERFPWVHRVSAGEEVSCSVPKLWPRVYAEIALLNDYNRRHAMWREEVVMRRQNCGSRCEGSVAHRFFDFSSFVQCVEIGLEELGNDVSSEVDWWSANLLLAFNLFLRLRFRLGVLYHLWYINFKSD